MAFGRRSPTLSESDLSTSSRYERHCPRCAVTFPVEQRKCLHCGGPTQAGPPADFGMGEFERAEVAAIEASYGVSDSSPIEPTDESPFEDRLPGDWESAGEDRGNSIAATLSKSLGSVIWLVLVLGFMAAKNC